VANADREQHQQQRCHMRIAVQHLFGKAGKLVKKMAPKNHIQLMPSKV
jgi:hypothetical protein